MHTISNWMGDVLPLARLRLRPPAILPQPPVAILGMVGVAIDDATARPVPAPAAHHPPLPPTPPVLAPDQQIDRLAAQVARFLSGGGIAPSLPLGPRRVAFRAFLAALRSALRRASATRWLVSPSALPAWLSSLTRDADATYTGPHHSTGRDAGEIHNSYMVLFCVFDIEGIKG